MARKKRTPEENEHRARIRELLQLSKVSSVEDIQNLFKEPIAEFMENGQEAGLDEELGYSKYDYKNKETGNSRNGHSFVLHSRYCFRQVKRAQIVTLEGNPSVLFLWNQSFTFKTYRVPRAAPVLTICRRTSRVFKT